MPAPRPYSGYSGGSLRQIVNLVLDRGRDRRSGVFVQVHAILVPPILAIVWWIVCWQKGERQLFTLTRRVALSMTGFLVVMLLSDAAVTGFACLPLSSSQGRHPTIEKWFGSSTGNLARSCCMRSPLPQDWVGFTTQMHHQASGGPSYLFGERRMNGWWYYYLVALTVKVPLTFWLLVARRLALLKPDRASISEAQKYDNDAPLVFLPLHGYHGDWLIAQLRCALPSSPSTTGNRMDLSSW